MSRVLIIMFAFFILFGSIFTYKYSSVNTVTKGSVNPIVGSWQYEGGGYTYTFNEDGTGKYELGGTSMEFSYETKDDNKISILYKGNTTPFETEYKVEGNTLNVIDSYGNDTIYKKIK